MDGYYFRSAEQGKRIAGRDIKRSKIFELKRGDKDENCTRVQRLLPGCVLQKWDRERHYPADAGAAPGADG